MEFANSFTFSQKPTHFLQRDHHTDRHLELNGVEYSVHDSLAQSVSPVLADLFDKERDSECVSLESLRSCQPCLSNESIEYVLKWMYGQPVTVHFSKIADALAIAQALVIPEMAVAIEEQIIDLSHEPVTALVALEHAVIGNVSSANAELIFQNCVSLLPILSSVDAFGALSFIGMKTLIEKSLLVWSSPLDTHSLFETVITWTEANEEYEEQTILLLERLSIELLNMRDIRNLIKRAQKANLSDLAEFIISAFKGEIRKNREYLNYSHLETTHTERMCAGASEENLTFSTVSDITSENISVYLKDYDESPLHRRANAGVSPKENSQNNVSTFSSNVSTATNSTSFHKEYNTPRTQSVLSQDSLSPEAFGIDLGILPATNDGKYDIEVTFSTKDGLLSQNVERIVNFDLDLRVEN